MKGKKMPLWLRIILLLLLAFSCVGTTWLFTAAVADPVLFDQVTSPVVAFVVQQVENAEKQVEKVGNAIDRSLDQVKDHFAQKAEEKKAAQEAQIEIATVVEDSQEFQDSLLIPPDMANYAVTHFDLDEFTGLERLLGGNQPLVYFNQVDPQYTNYGTDTMSGYGCGPTAMAMVVSTLTDRYITPQEMGEIFVQEGYWCPRSGTYNHFAQGSAQYFGLEIESLVPEEITADDLLHHLLGDKLVIALMTQGHFTNGGHFIVLRGTTLSGDILVADPASRERSLSTWTAQLILDELSGSRTHGCPLWVFSLPQTME